MKKTVIIILLAFIPLISYNQDTEKFLTIYSNGYLEEITIYRKTFQCIGFFPSVAFHKESNRWLYQVDFMPILFAVRDHLDVSEAYLEWSGTRQTLLESSIGLITKFCFFRNNIIQMNLSFDNRLFYLLNSYNPHSSAISPHSDNNIGWSVALGFEFEKPITDNLSFSIMPQYRINEFYYHINKVNNPLLYDQIQSKFVNKFNPKIYQLKIGLKIKI